MGLTTHEDTDRVSVDWTEFPKNDMKLFDYLKYLPNLGKKIVLMNTSGVVTMPFADQFDAMLLNLLPGH